MTKIHLGVTPGGRDKNRTGLLRQSRTHNNLFLFVSILPIILYLFFVAGLLKSNGGGGDNDGIQAAVALVRTNEGTGTAFLVSSSKLLTARHVVENLEIGTTVSLEFKRTEPEITTTARLLWKDTTPYEANSMDYFLTDAAVLELENPADVEGITALDLGDSDNVVADAEVILIGYPGADFSFTRGTINNETFNDLNLFKLDATADPGNSGGPCILADDNTVIGILVGKKTLLSAGQNISNKINRITTLLSDNDIDIYE